MSGSGHAQLKFDGELTWKELKKQINLAGRGIPDTALVLLTTDGSSDSKLREQTIHVDWDMSEVEDRDKPGR